MKEINAANQIMKTMATIEYTPLVESKEMLYYLVSGGYYMALDGYDIKRSGYNTMLLIYTMGGKGRLTYLDKNYDILPGSAFIIDCNFYQNYAASEEGWRFYWMHFGGGASREIIRSIAESGGPVYEHMDLKALMEQIFILGDRPSKKSDILINQQINEALTLLMLKSGEYSHVPWAVDKAVKFIRHNSQSEITLDDISRHCNVSKYHLSRLFKSKIGMNPYGYLISHRLNQAKYLLVTTEDSIAQIAWSVGFRNLSGFMRHFKEAENCTPLKYRQLRR